MLATDTRQTHVAVLDGWRGLAILIVLLGHFGGDGRLTGLSVTGVDLFFVLSGRLMAEILFIRRVPLPLFFARRFSRVFPALAVFVALVGLSFSTSSLGPRWPDIAATLTFTMNYYILIEQHFVPVFDHVWSLSVEEHSYLLLGLIAFLIRKFPAKWPIIVLFTVGVSMLANAVIQFDILDKGYFRAFWRTDTAAAPIFLAGAAFLLLQRHAKDFRCPPWLAPAALVAGIAARLSGGTAFMFFAMEVLCFVVAIASIEQAARPVKQFFEATSMRQLGRLSFSLYLWQEPFYQLAKAVIVPAWLGLPLAFACSVASYNLVEKPMRSWLNARIANSFSRRPNTSAP